MKDAANHSSDYDPKKCHRRTLGYYGWKIRLLCWTIVNQTLFRYSPFFCYGWRRFLLRCFGARIARTATVSRRVTFQAPWNLVMGEKSMIGMDSFVQCHGPVILGENVVIGEFAKVITGGHSANSKSYKPYASQIEFCDNSWVATGAIIASGGRRKLKVGEGAIVGVGAVVLLSVPRMTVVAGNPAQEICQREFTKE